MIEASDVTVMEDWEQGDHKPIPGKPRRRCPQCGYKRYDVQTRPDGYAQEIHDEFDATWVACGGCDHQNDMDI